MRDDSKYQKLLIKDFEHWRLYLHPNQSYLGRVYFWAKKEELEDFADMGIWEMDELHDMGLRTRRTLSELFQPSLFNWAALGNETRHLHMHLVPRYEKPKVFKRITFTDELYGKNFRTEQFKEIPEEVLMKIKENIQKRLQ